MKVIKKEAKAKEVEKLFRYTKELERIRDNVKILLENQNALDDEQKNIKEDILHFSKLFSAFLLSKIVSY